jgi:hypothetical protein
MKNTAAFRRTAGAVALVAAALLMVVSIVLEPEFPGGFADRLAAVDEGGTSAAVSAVTFALAQLPFIIGVLAIGHLLRDRAPMLSNVGTSLAVLGGFGHSVFGGISMAMLAMAADAPNRAVHADLLEQIESGPAVVFMAMGLLGTVFGILLLGIGLFRARVVPRWVPILLWAFLVVEFAGTALSEWASSVSGVLYLVALTSTAVAIWRSPISSWENCSVARESAPEPRTASLS